MMMLSYSIEAENVEPYKISIPQLVVSNQFVSAENKNGDTSVDPSWTKT